MSRREPAWRRYRRLFGPDPEADLEDELRFHLERRTEELIARGVEPEEARREARRRMGDLEAVRKEAGGIGRRALRGRRRREALEGLVRDVRIGVRSLVNRPGLAAAAVITLGVGIGATTGIFSVVRSVLLRPAPYPHPEELVAVWSRFEPRTGFDFPRFPLSFPEYRDFRDETRSFSGMAAYTDEFGVNLAGPGGDRAARVEAAAVAPAFFDVLGAAPAMGRPFRDPEAEPGPLDAVILSHALWRGRFGADPEVLGRTVRVNGASARVVGVAPPELDFPSPAVELFLPLQPGPDAEFRTSHSLGLLARLKPDVSPDRAGRETDALMRSWRGRFPEHHDGHALYARPLREERVGDARTPLLVLIGAVGLVLVVACANVANLLLARGETRRGELGLRLALGAGRGRILRQVSIEHALLAGAGGALGVALAAACVPALLSLYPGALPAFATVTLDPAVLGFACAASLGSALLVGLLPALRATRTDPRAALAGEVRGAAGRGRRIGRGLLVAEVALAVLLVVGAGLLMRSFVALQRVDPGFRAEGVLLARAEPTTRPTRDGVLAFWGTFRRRIAASSAVETVGASSAVPFAGGYAENGFEIEGRPPPEPGDPAWIGRFSTVSPGWFRTLGIPLVAGRRFRESDGPDGVPVAIVSRTLAERYFPEGDAVGARVRALGLEEGSPWLTVVGVVGDVRALDPREPPRPMWYIPHAQVHRSYPPAFFGRAMTVAVRGAGGRGALADALRGAAAEVDPAVPLWGVEPLERVAAEAAAPERFTSTLMSVFAGIALLLGALGIYSVMAYGVARRRGEIGVRLALGADEGRVRRLVVRQGMGPALLGLAVGLGGALLAGRLLRGLLYGVRPADPWTLTGVVALVVGVALAACWVPAHRASRVDPVVALRTE